MYKESESQVTTERVVQSIAPKHGELVSCMRSMEDLFFPKFIPYRHVSRLVSVHPSPLTRKPRWIVEAVDDSGKDIRTGIMVIRDAEGYLHEVPAPVCNTCEGITECECREV